MPEKQRAIHAFFLTEQNAFQREQARAAESSATGYGYALTTRYAESNAMIQIHQLFESVHAKSGPAPDAILVEAVTADGLPRVARNAAAAGIGWGVVNSDATYLAELRGKHPGTPIFGARFDDVRVGEIQGAQTLKLLGGRRGASVLCVQGPLTSSPAQDRLRGLNETLAGRDISITGLDTDWTVAGAKAVVGEWLRLGKGEVDLVVGQNDEIAEGARAAIGEQLGAERQREIPFIGCDGLPTGGRAMVESGALAATVVLPLPARRAMELFHAFFERGEMPPELTMITPESYPPLEKLGGFGS